MRMMPINCVSRNDTDVAHYNFNAHQLILVIFGRDVAERVCYQVMLCYPTSLHYLGKHELRKLCLTVGLLAFEGSVVTQKWLVEK